MLSNKILGGGFRRASALGLTIAIGIGALAGCSAGTTATHSASTSGGGSTNIGVPEGAAKEQATLAQEIKAEGGEKTAGAWRIAYIVEGAEPWYLADGGKQVLREPAAGETHHIEIIPIEAATGRIIPEVPIRLEVIDPSGKVVDAKELNFYYAEFFHYANNFAIPQAGTYTLRATLGAPTFLRHGEKGHEPALADGATATFTGVKLEPTT
ncbi:hypothetical protein GCM10023176_08110 [Micromonospora coerulea]|uniref:Lipoprotein n=1 Tax=Micromonospora coerulea TaxID=47856 RepID=A0ABP8S9S7_9ACTN